MLCQICRTVLQDCFIRDRFVRLKSWKGLSANTVTDTIAYGNPTSSPKPIPKNVSRLLVSPVARKKSGAYSLQVLTEFFIDTVREFGGVPIAIPGTISDSDIDQILALVDGVILTGGSTHVAPTTLAQPMWKTTLMKRAIIWHSLSLKSVWRRICRYWASVVGSRR